MKSEFEGEYYAPVCAVWWGYGNFGQFSDDWMLLGQIGGMLSG